MARVVPGTPAFWAPQPDGFIAQRRPISMVMMKEENDCDHADRTSGGLLRGRETERGMAGLGDCPVSELCCASSRLGCRSGTTPHSARPSQRECARSRRGRWSGSQRLRSVNTNRVRGAGAWLSFRREKVPGTPSIASRGGLTLPRARGPTASDRRRSCSSSRRRRRRRR